jgi:hypothetical protein
LNLISTHENPNKAKKRDIKGQELLIRGLSAATSGAFGSDIRKSQRAKRREGEVLGETEGGLRQMIIKRGETNGRMGDGEERVINGGEWESDGKCIKCPEGRRERGDGARFK